MCFTLKAPRIAYMDFVVEAMDVPQVASTESSLVMRCLSGDAVWFNDTLLSGYGLCSNFSQNLHDGYRTNLSVQTIGFPSCS